MAKGALERVHHAFAQYREESVMASTSSSLALHPRTFIEVLDNEGEWFVRVVQDGQETVRTFDKESFAQLYAEEQRLILGLKFVRQM
jgi:hypothetical protein